LDSRSCAPSQSRSRSGKKSCAVFFCLPCVVARTPS
jgi:hypothetical protein